jgi:hypothetical protein
MARGDLSHQEFNKVLRECNTNAHDEAKLWSGDRRAEPRDQFAQLG